MPVTTSAYELGTSTKSWLAVTTDKLCLTGDVCRTTWPSGSGGVNQRVNTSTATFLSVYLTTDTVTGTALAQVTAGTLTFSSTTVHTNISATGVTTTNLSSGLSSIGLTTITNGTSTNFFSGLLQYTNLLGTNATTTNLSVSGALALPNVSVTDAMVASAANWNNWLSYPALATSTFVAKSATTSFPNLTAVGTLANLLFTNATGTNLNIKTGNFLFKGFSVPSSSLVVGATTSIDLPPFPEAVTLNTLTCGTNSGSSTVQVGSSTLSVPVFASSTGTVLPEISLSSVLPAYTKWHAEIGTILAASNMPTRYVFCTLKYQVN